MATRTGKLILARDIKLDKNYKNIMDYSESDMVDLLESKAVGIFNNCSFLRPGENSIKVELSYGQALQANYIGFQDPDYSNKWFFGFIDRVEYISEKTVGIYYSIDQLSTWYSYWNPRSCFVVREHTNDDTIGINTLPENVDLGEFIFNGEATDFGITSIANNCYVALGVSKVIPPFDTNPLINWLRVYGGIYSGITYYLFDSWVDLTRVLDFYAVSGKAEAVQTIFYVPYDFVAGSDPKTQTYQLLSTTNTATITWIEPSDAPVSTSHIFTKPTNIAGFTPKNNKLLTYPYCFFNITNNAGTECEYRYEDFSSDPTFYVSTALSPSMTTKASAYNYKGGATKETWGEGIVGGKTPQCSWVTDYYVNWLTQNGINNAVVISPEGVAEQMIQPPLSAISAITSGLTAGMATGNPLVGMGMGLANSIGSTIAENIRASKVPDLAKGNINAGDINFAKGKSCFTFIPKCIKPEYARIIDDYFTLFGYKTSRLKLPNQTGRRYWNYVQIAEGESIGFTSNQISVPSNAMEIINTAYQRGVTIWHDHENIGNYTLNNTIV